MAYAQPTRDIRTGEIFIDRRDGSRVIIVAAGNHYVEFMRGCDHIEIFYERHFRERFAATYDRARLRSQFSMSLANLDSFHAFWCPASQKLFARSAGRAVEDAYKPSRGRGGALPRTARYVGTYSNPCSPSTFLENLDDHLAKLQRCASLATATG